MLDYVLEGEFVEGNDGFKCWFPPVGKPHFDVEKICTRPPPNFCKIIYWRDGRPPTRVGFCADVPE